MLSDSQKRSLASRLNRRLKDKNIASVKVTSSSIQLILDDKTVFEVGAAVDYGRDGQVTWTEVLVDNTEMARIFGQ